MRSTISRWHSAWQKATPREKAHMLLNLAFEAGIFLFLVSVPLPKTISLRYLGLGLAVFAWVGKMALFRRFLWRRTPLDWLWVVFLAVAMLVSYFAVIPDQSWKFFRRELLFWAALYFLLVHNLEKPGQVKRICGVLLLSLTALSLYGIIDFFRGAGLWKGWRVASVFGTPGHAAYFIIMILPLALAAFFYFKSLGSKLLWAAPLAAGGGLLMMTFARGAWLGTLAAAFLIGIIKDRKFLIFLLVGVILAGVLIPRAFISRQIFHDPTRENFTDWELDTGFRQYAWLIALHMIKDRPWLGVGLGEANFRAEYPNYLPPEKAIHIFRYRNVHNFYLQTAVETGLIGFLAFFSLILAAAWMVWKAYRAARAVGEAQLTGFLLGMVGVLLALGIYGLVSHRFEKEVAFYFWTYGALAFYVNYVWAPEQRKIT
jgi:putative inorganic carbon (HCO3(-)) transporter